MIRFIDLSDDYWTYWTDSDSGHPVCAFLSTRTNRFLWAGTDRQVFSSLDEIREHPSSERMMALVPEGFFEQVRGSSSRLALEVDRAKRLARLARLALGAAIQ